MWRQRDVEQSAVNIEEDSNLAHIDGIKFHELSLEGRAGRAGSVQKRRLCTGFGAPP
jgi:hypothetical protein